MSRSTQPIERLPSLVVPLLAMAISAALTAAEKPIRVFILAGDENMLEQGVISRQDRETKQEPPGTLADVVTKQPRFAFLRGGEGHWITRNDVVLYDAHPIHNDTVSMGHPLQIGDVAYGGKQPRNAIGPELMFGHVVGGALEEPVFLIRFAAPASAFHSPGSRSLAHDFCSPSKYGGVGLDGSWDVIHFNWGVWDTYMRRKDGGSGWDKENGSISVSIEEYEKNLRMLVARMKKTGATLIWGSITPIHEDCPSTFKGDEVRYNEVAAGIMKENGVIINDLYSESLRQGFPKHPDVHSVGDLGPITLKAVQEALKNRKTLSRPLPRVLFIGDSISKYWGYVKKALDGTASVYHNPGNGEHTGTGLKNIDAWLDLETYLLNGQEYLELVKSVQAVLSDPKRFYPDYKGQKLELAGLVWFQGISDTHSEVKAKAYERNLACLMADLRKDLNVPNLPMVVAANWHGNAPKGSPQEVVHAAQMAMGSAQTHPEFSGTVASIDTTPFYRDKKQSPGYYLNPNRPVYYADDHCNNNAESFLLIGESMGQAMLKLLGRSRRE